MSAKKKTVFKGFDYMHCDDFARFLSDMAAKGWHFREWGVGLKFEKGEPEQVTYAIEVFSGASDNDMRPEPHTQEFAEYCEAAGWKLMDAKQKFCIFKKVDEQAVAMFTPEERVRNACKASISGTALALLILAAVNVALQWINFTMQFERYIFSGALLFTFCLWHAFLIGQSFKFIYVFYKKRQLSKKIKEGKDIYIGSNKEGRQFLSVKEVGELLLLLLLSFYFLHNRIDLIIVNAIIIFVTVLLAIILNKIRPDASTSVAIQSVVAISLLLVFFIYIAVLLADDNEMSNWTKDDLPLEVTDYRECTDTIESLDIYHDSTFLGNMDKYYIFMENDLVYYEVYESNHAWILDEIWKDVLDAKYNEDAVDCTTDWEAQLALRNKLGRYYIRYENKIFILSDDEDIYMTPEQIAIIRDTMDLR